MRQEYVEHGTALMVMVTQRREGDEKLERKREIRKKKWYGWVGGV